MKSEEIKNLFEEFEPNISIKAKDLAAEMTSVNIQQKDLHVMTNWLTDWSKDLKNIMEYNNRY